MKNENKRAVTDVSKTQALVESAVLIAIGTLLSLLRIVDLPFGGSVTLGSMLPVIIIAYRHGLGLGLASGAVYGVIQQLLGLNTLSYVTTWQSVLAVILLDYVIAFLVLGFGGVFRRLFKTQAPALVCGSLAVCVLRYACHVLSGATVWAGLSIPTTDALTYSFAYNATYMLPETIVLAVIAYYMGSTLDFRAKEPVRLVRDRRRGKAFLLSILAGLALSAAAVIDVAAVFSKLQDGETGVWDFTKMSGVNWLLVGVVTTAGVMAAALLFILSKKEKKAAEDDED